MKIKIRAFDETSGEFACSDNAEQDYYFWGFDRNGEVACYFEVEKLGNSEFDPPEIVPEEVSGPYELWSTYQDVNGEDLYAGDMVEIEGDFGTEQFPDRRTITDVIEFKGGAFYPVCEYPDKHLKKIGNIHQEKADNVP